MQKPFWALAVILTLSPLAQADQAAAMRSGCLGCHQLQSRTVGPSVAELQELLEQSDLDTLVKHIQQGRSGAQLRWGKIAMPPNQSPAADIRAALEWMKAQ